MKSLLYTVLNTITEVALNNAIPLGFISRKYGCNIVASGSAITIKKPGYYDIDVSAVIAGQETGDITLTLLQDGIEVPGATGTETFTVAATQPRNISFSPMVRVFCCKPSMFQIVVSGTTAPIVSNLAVKIVEV